MILVPIRAYLNEAPEMTKPLQRLIWQASEDKMIQTVGEVTDRDIEVAIDEPGSFWKVGVLADKPYKPCVGLVSLHRFNPVDGTGELGVSVFPEYQEQGFGTQLVLLMRQWAVDTLNLRKTENFVLADSPVIGIAKRVGDVLEGTLKAHRYKNGSYVDVYIYSWLREGK